MEKKCRKICVVGFEKYLRDQQEEEKLAHKKDEIRKTIREIAKKEGKEWKLDKNKNEIWRFIGAISNDLNEITEDSIKNAAINYCNNNIEKMDKKWLVPYAEYTGVIAEILGLDEALKRNICEAVARYI
ncbi:MAG: hypothetical protein M1331_00155 [Candidatus Marsarchaeota archaeon]|nr:hypothetical protein [Candidatus Marsarchaeota archaeon]